MELRKFVACTACAAALVAATGCAEGTGQALTPTLPTIETTTNADGTKLKASAPQPSAPRASVRVSNLTPQLSIVNAAPTESNSSASLSYQFEISEGSTVVVQSPIVSASTDTTTLWTVPSNTLKLNKTYSWRARALFASVDGSWVDGSWSDAATFRTPLPPPMDGPVACAGSAGAEIVRCVGAAYPAYLVPTEAGANSLERRKANMAFIRDRIIETGLCKGLNLGRNFKRGGPEISFDFIVWRSDRDRGVDLATGYDELKLPIRLKWQVFGADESYGFPFYSKYPAVDCSAIQ
jgi:hypothetical protein